MQQNIVEIQVPAGLPEDPQETEAGVMFEHNAAALRFVLDAAYLLPEYRYYLEFVTANGVQRTEYLTPDEDGAILFSVPVDVTAQMTALCCLNVVAFDEAGVTQQLVKCKRVYLYFSPLENTDKQLCADYAFSVNTLLEAIQNGTFRGEQGERGEKGEKGDKGDKGDPGVDVDETVTETSQNPVAAAGIAAYVEEKRERLVGVVELGEGETLDEAMLTTDLQGKPFRLGHMYLYAHLVFDTDEPSFNIRIRSDAGVRYFVYHQFKDAASVKELDVFLEAHISSVLTQSRFVYGTAAQGLDAAEQKITLCNTVPTGIQDVRLALSEGSGAVRIPLLAGSRIVVTGTDWCEG